MGQRQLFRQQQQQQRRQQRLPEAQQRGGVGPRVHTQEQEILLGTYLGAEPPVCSRCVGSDTDTPGKASGDTSREAAGSCPRRARSCSL